MQKYPRFGKRRSIKHDTPNKFVGWDKIMEYHDLALDKDREKSTEERSLYFTTLFETGGRISEVLLLTPKQFVIDDKSITIENMEVYKRRTRFTRDVIIRIEGNPLAPVFIRFVEDCKTTFLLPGRQRFTSEIIPNKHISASTVYNKVVEIHPDVWPHFLRDQRAYHLAAKIEEGGREFDPYDHRKWFEWARMEMPLHYVGRRREEDIKRALGL